MTLEIIFEDNHLLVVSKPAGLLTQGDITGDENLLDRARRYRQQHENKPGNVYVGLVHRLDRPVSGVIVLAKTSKAASRLSEQFRSHNIDKQYLAVVELPSEPLPVGTDGIWEDRLSKDEQTNKVRILGPRSPANEGQIAKTHFRVLAEDEGLALLQLSPLTGRSHQLRVQSASRGMPIFGDLKYSSAYPFGSSLALHAFSLAIEHPTKKEPLIFRCLPPASWRQFPFHYAKLTT